MAFSTFIAGCRRITNAPPPSSTPSGPVGSEATLAAAGGAVDGAGKGGRPVISNGARMSIFAPIIERNARMQATGSAAPPSMVRQPITSRADIHPATVRDAAASTRRTSAAQAAYDREQRVNNARVIAETTAIARQYREAERRAVEAASPAGQARASAISVHRAAAKARGETFDVSTYVSGPAQGKRMLTTEMIKAHVEGQGRKFYPGPSQAGFPGDTGDCE